MFRELALAPAYLPRVAYHPTNRIAFRSPWETASPEHTMQHEVFMCVFISLRCPVLTVIMTTVVYSVTDGSARDHRDNTTIAPVAVRRDRHVRWSSSSWQLTTNLHVLRRQNESKKHTFFFFVRFYHNYCYSYI